MNGNSFLFISMTRSVSHKLVVGSSTGGSSESTLSIVIGDT